MTAPDDGYEIVWIPGQIGLHRVPAGGPRHDDGREIVAEELEELAAKMRDHGLAHMTRRVEYHRDGSYGVYDGGWGVVVGSTMTLEAAVADSWVELRIKRGRR